MRTIKTERFMLDGDTLPNTPIPHDCVIESIQEDNEYLILIFENRISQHDSIRAYQPYAKSLRMRFHKRGPEKIDIYQYKKTKHHEGYMKVKDMQRQILNWKRSAEYLNHYLSPCRSVIVELYADSLVFLMIETDFIEYEWVFE